MNLITLNHKDGLVFDLRVRNRHVQCDMAPQDGGKGAGFTPAELFAGALGACIAMAVQSACDECPKVHGHVSVSLAFEFMGNPRRIGAIVVDVEVPPEVPEDKHELIRHAAETAVIQQTLRNPPRVDVDILVNHHSQPLPA